MGINKTSRDLLFPGKIEEKAGWCVRKNSPQTVDQWKTSQKSSKSWSIKRSVCLMQDFIDKLHKLGRTVLSALYPSLLSAVRLLWLSPIRQIVLYICLTLRLSLSSHPPSPSFSLCLSLHFDTRMAAGLPPCGLFLFFHVERCLPAGPQIKGKMKREEEAEVKGGGAAG